MSRATHILVISKGASAVPSLEQGAEIPLVKGQHEMDWDVVEEELDAEWLAEMRVHLRLKQGEDDDGKPIGVRTKDVVNACDGIYIREKENKSMSTLPTIDAVVAKYVETREQLKQMQADLDEQMKPLKEFQKKREQWLLSELQKQGALNAKTPHGTAYITTTESVTMADWDQFFDYVLETGQYNLLTHAVNKTAALEIMGEERANPLPPGVSYTALRTVNVRKS